MIDDIIFRFYMFIWDNMIVEVCAKERKKNPRHETREAKHKTHLPLWQTLFQG